MIRAAIKKIRKFYGSLTPPLLASFWFAASSILQKGIQFLVVPLLTRLMPASDYGRYSVFLSWYQLITIFATLNLGNYVLNNGMIKYEDDKNGYISSLRGLSALVTIGLFLLYLPFADKWERATSLSFTMMAAMFLELLLVPSYDYWCARERFEYKFKATVAMSVAVTVLIPAVSIPLVIWAEDKGLAAIMGRTLASAGVYIIPTVLTLLRSRRLFNKDYWSFALKFNLPLIPHFLSLVILQQSDRIMISHLVGDDKAGIYSVAYSAAMLIQVINGAILATFVPYTYRALKNKSYNGIRRNANWLLGCIAALNLMLICVAPEAIRLLGPAEYHEAMYIIPPVALSGIFGFLFNLFANIEYYFEKTMFVAIASIGSAALNVVLNAICIPKFGYIAAGYTTLICYMVYSLGHYIFMCVVAKEHLGGRKVYDMRAIMLIVAGSLVLGAVFLAMYAVPIARYAIVFAVVTVCVIKRDRIIDIIKSMKEDTA